MRQSSYLKDGKEGTVELCIKHKVMERHILNYRLDDQKKENKVDRNAYLFKYSITNISTHITTQNYIIILNLMYSVSREFPGSFVCSKEYSCFD